MAVLVQDDLSIIKEEHDALLGLTEIAEQEFHLLTTTGHLGLRDNHLSFGKDGG